MQANKKHIGIITTWFPPQHGVAVNRMLAFVKYLNHEKFDISVITLRTGKEAENEKVEGARVYRLQNRSILSISPTKPGESKIKHNLKVFWNLVLKNLKTLEYSGWMRSASRKLETIHSKNKIDVILSSFAPAEAHLAAMLFCRNHPEVKWIADMRDEMSGSPYISKRTKGLYQKIEAEMNAHVSAVTVASKIVLTDMKKALPSAKYFEEVRNGFDHTMTPKNNFNKVFTIAYAGTFYGNIKPDTFFKGLKQFVQKTKYALHLQFIGTNKNFELPAEFAASCEFIPKLENKEAVERMSKADATLLVIPSDGRKGVYTGKLFDYISVMKPIIAACDTTDVAAGLIRETNSGFVADFNDIKGIEKAITDAYMLWKEKRTLPMNKEKIAELHRKYQVKKLEALIDKLSAE